MTVIMEQMNLNLQEASDYIGWVFHTLLTEYLEAKSRLPTWSPTVDAAVQDYVTALEHWIIGNLVWSFESQRYFGAEHHEVKRTRVVTIKPYEMEMNSN